MITALVLGLGLTAAVTGLLALAWREAAVVPGLVFGLLATAIQVVSAALMKDAARREFKALMKRWGVGMGLRLGGIVAFGVAVGLRRDLFPPLPTAFAYLGVVVPLLFTEIRFLR
jgi:hypothetical protein